MPLVLSSSITSRQDLQAVILEIRSYAKWASQTVNKSQFSKEQATPPVASGAALDILKNWHEGQQVNLKSLDELINALEEFKASAPSMTITLAAPASGQLKKALTDWCRQNISPQVLVNFEFNSTMLGGMVVRFGSHIYDWSFRRQLLAARDRLPEVIRNV